MFWGIYNMLTIPTFTKLEFDFPPPEEKVFPLFPTNPPSKVVSSLPHFGNLLGGSTPPPPASRKGGAYYVFVTM